MARPWLRLCPDHNQAVAWTWPGDERGQARPGHARSADATFGKTRPGQSTSPGQAVGIRPSGWRILSLGANFRPPLPKSSAYGDFSCRVLHEADLNA